MGQSVHLVPAGHRQAVLKVFPYQHRQRVGRVLVVHPVVVLPPAPGVHAPQDVIIAGQRQRFPGLIGAQHALRQLHAPQHLQPAGIFLPQRFQRCLGTPQVFQRAKGWDLIAVVMVGHTQTRQSLLQRRFHHVPRLRLAIRRKAAVGMTIKNHAGPSLFVFRPIS